MDFNRYFLHERNILLDNISYEALPKDPQTNNYKLNCKDTILAQLTNNGVKICFNRTLTFNPEAIYSLSVTYALMLIFDQTTKDEIDWKKTDIAGEFKKNCPDLTQNMMARASLLIGEITSSTGMMPLITPSQPQPVK